MQFLIKTLNDDLLKNLTINSFSVSSQQLKINELGNQLGS